MRSALLWVLCVVHLSRGQSNSKPGDDRGLLLGNRLGNRRPLAQHSSPCWSGHSDGGYDSVDEDLRGRSLLALGAAGVAGAAVGYHLGMKHQNQPIINNNIYNEYPQPCVVVQGGGGGGWGGGGGGGGGGLLGGILGHHPILSNVLQGGLLGGGSSSSSAAVAGGGFNRQNNINWNRAIRQFNRVVRPITRGFK